MKYGGSEAIEGLDGCVLRLSFERLLMASNSYWYSVLCHESQFKQYNQKRFRSKIKASHLLWVCMPDQSVTCEMIQNGKSFWKYLMSFPSSSPSKSFDSFSTASLDITQHLVAKLQIWQRQVAKSKSQTQSLMQDENSSLRVQKLLRLRRHQFHDTTFALRGFLSCSHT